MFERYCEIFEKESGGLNPKSSKKAQVRLFEAIEKVIIKFFFILFKQRKVLSANSDSVLNIEYLMEDVDLNQHLKREEFEELIAPALKIF